MTNRSEPLASRLAVAARRPRRGALLAAALTLAVLLPLWLLAIGWYRAELLNGDPGQRSLLIFAAGGSIVMALLAGLVYLSVSRQASLLQAVQERTHEITRINQRLEADLARRQQIEEELRRSDERYRALARSFPNGAVFLFDASLRYTLADGAGLADVGLSKEMLEGLTIWEALPPDTVEIIEPHYRAALAGEPHVFEVNFGEHIYLVRTLPLRDDHGAILAGLAVTQDITDAKHAAQSLHRWAHIFEHADWGVAIGSADGRTLEMMNPAYAKMHGYTVEELSGLPIASVYAPGTEHELRALIQQTNETGHGVLESQHVRKDGTLFPVMVDLTAVKDAQGQVLYRVANVQDITARQQVEAALREREEQYRSIFEASLDGLFINSLDGYVVDVNPAGARMHGYTVDECRGLRSEQLVPPDRLSGLEEFIDTARAGGQFRAQGSDLRRDGSQFPVEIVGTQFIYRGKPHALAVVRDITERVKVEQTLNERELQYRNIFESSIDGLAINNLDGQLVEFNPAMAHMHGYTIDEFRHIQPGQFIHADSVPLFVAFMDTIRTGREYRCRAVDVRKDGSLFHIEVVGTPFTLRGEPHAFAIVRDVSAQVEAEEALREREAQYRSIFESVSDGLFIDTLDGEMIDFNPAVAFMHGYTVEEFRHIPTLQIIHPDSLHLFQEFVNTVKAGGLYRCRAIDVRKDGSLFPVEVAGTSITFRGQRHMLAVLHDITAQVQAEQLLEQRVTERTRELRALLDISYNVASTLELTPLLRLILDQLKVLVDYRGAALFALHGTELDLLDYRGPLSGEQLRLPAEWWMLNLDIVRRGEIILIADTLSDVPLAHKYQNWAGDLLGTILSATRTMLAIPLISKDSIIGLISLTYDEPDHFNEQHINLVRAIANQAAVAIENARLFAEAQGKAVLEERQRLARDLHDSVTQSLYSLTLLAEAGRRWIDQDVLQAAQYLSDMGEIAQQSLKEMRLLVYQLRPLALEHEGLIGALQARLDSVEKRSGVEARFLIEGSLGNLPPALEEGLFRIAQEALNNALKHAAARSIVVRLRGDDDCITLEVADDGRGSALLTSDVKGGLGLTSMQERVAHLQGMLKIESTPGRGTRVAVEVPRSLMAEA